MHDVDGSYRGTDLSRFALLWLSSPPPPPPMHQLVRQRRHCFLWRQQAMLVQEFLAPAVSAGLWTLQCQAEVRHVV
jgi:hypothetical protein